MHKKVDIVYVVASEIGSIGMGTTSYNAVRGIEKNGSFSFNVFCRGHDSSKANLKKENLKSYGFLEYISYPFRFLEKTIKIKINYFKHINKLFGDLVSKNLPKCKIYHTWMGLAPEAVLKAKRQGAILVLEGANSHPLKSLEICNKEYSKFNKKEFMTEPIKLRKEIELIQKFDYVMCPSDFVYDSFLKNGFSKKQLIKMPYGVDIERFKPNKKEKDKKFKAIFIGSLQLRKGLQYLLKAWNELKLENAELIIVGRVWPDAHEVINKYRKDSTIKFIGFDSNPSKYLRSSDVFISPSLEEGSALTCYEALASGVPLIATHNTGSVISDGKEGFIIPIRDVTALKDKINYFYSNPEETKRMGKNARKLAEKYSWDGYGERLAKVYKKILIENGK